jgi:hypothetical protein
MKGFTPEKLVFLDETSAKTNLTRLYGRVPQGKRLVDKTPHGHWVTSTYVYVVSVAVGVSGRRCRDGQSVSA